MSPNIASPNIASPRVTLDFFLEKCFPRLKTYYFTPNSPVTRKKLQIHKYSDIIFYNYLQELLVLEDKCRKRCPNKEKRDSDLCR